MFPIHFPKTLTILLSLLLFSTTTTTYAWSVSDVGKVVIAKEYNDLLGMWIERRLGLQVSASEDIFFMTDTGLGRATTQFEYSRPLILWLESAVLKAIKWSKVAKKNKADVHKAISCFGEYDESCMNRGRFQDRNHLFFEFASQNGGKQMNLILTIVDRAYIERKATLYLGLPEMNQLLGNIRKIDQGIKEAKNMEKNKELFN